MNYVIITSHIMAIRQERRSPHHKGEVVQGTTLADAAVRAGVRHLVYTSVGGVERVRGIPHFDTKWEIEQHVRRVGLPYTFLRPTTFTDVFTAKGAALGLGMMGAVLGRDKPLQMVAVRDIGVFARMAFADPGRYLGKEIELAGDELTVPEIAELLGMRRYPKVPKAVLRLFGKESRMLFWFGESGYRADVEALRALHPGLLTLKEWLALSR